MEKSELSKAWSIDPRERIKALSELASGSVSISNGIPIKRYYRSGVELERMAKVYEDENNMEKAFFLYIKYTTLFVECLPKHPDYKSPQTSNERKVVRSKLKTIFDRAEFIKNNLTITYAGQHKKWIMEEQIRKAEAEQKRLEEEARIEAEAVAAKRAEMERRETELALELEQIEKQLEETRTIAVKASEKPVVLPPPIQRQATYPSLPVETPPIQSNTSSFNEAFNMTSPSAPPVVSNMSLPSAPSAPSAHIQIISDTGPLPTVDRSTKPAVPQIDRSTKPAALAASDMFAEMMTQDSQRAVIVPTSLPDKFLSVCLDNTQKNIETCGILAAKLTANNFTITHVILPKQRGTPDSCQTLAEEELFEYQDKLDLITVGWIHTHPTQSAFLSSVDLHTHCSYQLMLREAIAIVCAPKHNSTGIFALTDPHGLDSVSRCTKSGFHPHPTIPPLFEDCKHVKMDSNLTAQVIDLR